MFFNLFLAFIFLEQLVSCAKHFLVISGLRVSDASELSINAASCQQHSNSLPQSYIS